MVQNYLLQLFDNKKIQDLFLGQNIKLSAEEKNLESITFYHGEGCRRCNNTGYKGRQGIYEVMDIDAEMIKKINEKADADVIKDLARKKGMITMMEDGLIKSKLGVTTIEEVLRVTRD